MVVQDADDKKERIKAAAKLHEMPFRFRLRMAPTRHVFLLLWTLIANASLGLLHALESLIVFPCRAKVEAGSSSIPKAIVLSLRPFLLYLWYGFIVSPIVHIPNGLVNNLIGLVNFFYQRYSFDSLSGRYTQPTVAELHSLTSDLEDELAVIYGVGKADFTRARLSTDPSLKKSLHSLGLKMLSKAQKKRPDAFSAEEMVGDEDEHAGGEDLYDILQVKRTATKDQIKQQYKKLAKVLHPDVVGAHSGTMSAAEKTKAEHRFERITDAFKTLSDPEKKRSYDVGGHQGLKAHQARLGKFVKGSDGEVLQTIFGGRVFQERLTGIIAPTQYHCRYYLGCNVGLADFEALQVLRYRLLAVELAKMLDVHALPTEAAAVDQDKNKRDEVRMSLGGGTAKTAPPRQRPLFASPQGRVPSGTVSGAKKPQPSTASSGEEDGKKPQPSTGDIAPIDIGTNEHNSFSADFISRCDAFTSLLAEACFGREMMFQLGECYVLTGRRNLGLISSWRFESHAYKRMARGLIKQAMHLKARSDTNPQNQAQLQQRIACEYFGIEFDTAAVDVFLTARQAATIVLNDPVATEEVRQKRKYALWYLGEMMMKKGLPWGQRVMDDMELQVYLVQASSSTRNTAPPPPF